MDMLILNLPLTFSNSGRSYGCGRLPEPPTGTSLGRREPVIEGFFNLVRVHTRAASFRNGSTGAIVFLAGDLVALRD